MAGSDGFVNAISKIGSQRHLASLRDSFASLMPVIMAGSLVTIINNIPIPGWKEHLPAIIGKINGNVWWGTLDMMTFLLVIVLAFNLARSYENGNPIIAATVAFSTYIAIVPQVISVTNDAGVKVDAWGFISRSFTNATSMLVAILVTIISVEIFVRLARNEKLVIKMPEGVPPAVARSFGALIPGMVAVIGTVAIVAILEAILHGTIFEVVTKVVSVPLASVADSLGSALLIAFLNHFLWVFGVHGANILEGILQPVLFPFISENIAAFAAGQPIPHIVTKPFLDLFVYIGGSGATLGLLFAIFISSKNKGLRSVANLAIAPGAFNINEPVIFGLPIVLNPVFAIPFILAPMVLAFVSYEAMALGIVAKTVVIVPWSMPPIISGFIATGGDIKASILQIVNIIISLVIYLPFIFVADQNEKKREAAALAAAKK